MAERLRGRRGVEQRKRRLLDHPLCARCLDEGRVNLTEQIDHIIPLSVGGTDTDDNVQGLCLEHHILKSATDGSSAGGAALHPDWLEPSAIPLTIVSGPPCSGKSTYVEQQAMPGDIRICLDSIKREIDPGFRHWSGPLDYNLFVQAVRLRNARLGELKRAKAKRAWFIISAPTEAERKWWQGKLGGEVLLLHPGAAECKRRAIQRGTPKAQRGVDKWERQAKMPWLPREPKPKQVRIRADGTPEGWD
jgi:hypothetical protein